MAKEKSYRPKTEGGKPAKEVTFPTTGGEFKTVKKFPYTPENDDEERFFAAHPRFTDKPKPKKKKKQASRRRSSGSTPAGAGAGAGGSQSPQASTPAPPSEGGNS